MLHVTPDIIRDATLLPGAPAGSPTSFLARLSPSQLRMLFHAHKAAADALTGVYNKPYTNDDRATFLIDAETQRHEGAVDDIVKIARAMDPTERDERIACAALLLDYEAWVFDDSYLALAEAFIDGVAARNRRELARHANRA